jgi:hypothetical protein
MNRKNRQSISLLLVFAFVFQLFIPAFGQSGTDESLAFRQQRCQAAYMDYTTSVASGADLETVQKKLEFYLQTYKEYQNAAKGVKSELQQPTPQISGALAPTEPGVTTGTATAATPEAVVAGDQAGTQEQQSWFARMFNKVKELVIGKEGVKEMPLWEKVLWKVGKALIPAFGVMAAATLLAPFSPLMMIVGGIVVGAGLGGTLTYAFEKRMNAKYRETPKEDAKIWRDVSVQATVEAVMAPFNLATGGLFGMVGPTVGSAIGRVALTQAAISFTGSAISSRVGGLVKHLWAEHYFHYPEKIAANQKQIDEILQNHLESGTSLSAQEWAELDRLRKEVDMMKGEDYTHEDFVKDLKRAAMSAAITGFVGSVVSDRFYTFDEGRWADRLSLKVFGTAAQGKQISALVSTLPVNFFSGTAGATLEKTFIDQDVLKMREEQRKYPANSAAALYYENLIRQMEDNRDAIEPFKAGLDSMLNNFAVRSAQLSVQALKHNLYDAPKAKKQAIEQRYRDQDPEWKKAATLYEKYQATLKKIPSPRNYKTPATYARAQANYVKSVQQTRQAWLNQCTVASNRESLPEQQSIKAEITTNYEQDLKLNQMLELGRLQGGMAHLEAMKKVIQAKNPDKQYGESELTGLAVQAVCESYQIKHQSCVAKVEDLEKTMKDFEAYKAGRLQLTAEQAKILEGQKALISPSQYKAALVEKKVFELKAGNARWDEVRERMPEILLEAERVTKNQYGGSWGGIILAEMYANGLAKYKYSPDGSVNFAEEMKKMATRIPGLIESGVVDDYKTRVNNAIVSNVLPGTTAKEGDFEKYMQTFAKTAIQQGSGGVIDSVYSSSKDAIFGGF